MAKIAKIPVIDISGADQAQVAQDLVEAAIEHGFIYIKNTGKDIPAEDIKEAFEISKKLFNAPLSEKQACSIQKNNQGWSGMQVETLDPATQRVGDFKEAFNFGPSSALSPSSTTTTINDDDQLFFFSQPLPPTIAPYAPRLASFQSLCSNLCLKILTLLARGLSISPPSFFSSTHVPPTESGSILRLLYYPPPASTPEANPSSDVRAGAHSDYGSVTLLFRLPNQAGLEILTTNTTTTTTTTPDDANTKETSKWAPVPVTPPGTENDPWPPILLNIGDLLSYWTNGLLRSTVHRVVFPRQRQDADGALTPGGETGGDDDDRKKDTNNEARYSMAYFCHPVGTTPLTPLPSERVRNHVPDGEKKGNENPYAERKVLTADEHLQMRLRASYLQLYKDKE